MIRVTKEELEIVYRSCLDNIKYVQIKRRNRKVLSYIDLTLEMNSLNTIKMIEEIWKERKYND